MTNAGILFFIADLVTLNVLEFLIKNCKYKSPKI